MWMLLFSYSYGVSQFFLEKEDDICRSLCSAGLFTDRGAENLANGLLIYSLEPTKTCSH